MDFTDLANSIKEYIRPGSTAIRTAPGQTYGPAVSRTTGVPISFRSLSNGESGKYENRYTSPLGQLLPGNRGQIYIDPTSDDFKNVYKGNSAPVVQHEAAHAILENSLDDPTYNTLALMNKQFPIINSKLDRAGYMPAEVPAYMSESGAAQRWGIPQNIVDLYRQQFAKQVGQLQRTTGADYTNNIGAK